MSTVHNARIGAKFLHLYGGPHDNGRWEVCGEVGDPMWPRELTLPHPANKDETVRYLLVVEARGMYYRYAGQVLQ